MKPSELLKQDGYTLALTVGEWAAKPGPLVIRAESGRLVLILFALGWFSLVFTARDQEKMIFDGFGRSLTRTRRRWLGVLRNEHAGSDWSPRHGDVVIVEGRDRADVLLSDPEQRMALVRTRLGERVEKPWSSLTPVEAQEVAA